MQKAKAAKKEERERQAAAVASGESTENKTPTSDMSSMVWDFFQKPDFPVEYVPCSKCNVLLAYKGTTSGLKKHLKAKHFADYQRIMMQKGVTGTSNCNYNHSELLLARAFCTGHVPYEFVENPEFKFFLNSLNCEFKVPSINRIREVLMVNTSSLIRQNTFELSGAKDYVIITDGLSESKFEGPTFLSVYVAHVDQYTFERKLLLCGLTYMDEKSDRVGNMRRVQNLVENVGLKYQENQIIVCDMDQNSEENGLNIRNIPCAGLAISQIFEEFASRVKNAAKIHQDIKLIYGVLEEDEARLAKALSLQKDYKVQIPLPLKSSTSKWGSLFTDMQAYIANEAYFVFVPNLSAKEHQLLNSRKLPEAQNFVKLLQPLHIALEALTSENSFCSDIVPNLLCAKEDFDENDPSAVVLAELVQEKITAYLSNDIILVSMISDPRYAYVPNLIDPRTWQEAEQLLLAEETVASALSSSSPNPVKEEGSEESARGLAGLLKRKIKSECPAKNLASELLHYQALMATNRPCHTSDPLQFWKDQQHNLPKLASLSIKNLVAMASTTVSEKLFRKCSGLINSKVSRIDKRDIELYLLENAISPKTDLLEEENSNYHEPEPESFLDNTFLDFTTAPDEPTTSSQLSEVKLEPEDPVRSSPQPMPEFGQPSIIQPPLIAPSLIAHRPPQLTHQLRLSPAMMAANNFPINPALNPPSLSSNPASRIGSRIAPPISTSASRPIFFKDNRL
ncbi:unnamed protein product [Caenorhabditis nigoni]